jgi:hypothetical protein
VVLFMVFMLLLMLLWLMLFRFESATWIVEKRCNFWLWQGRRESLSLHQNLSDKPSRLFQYIILEHTRYWSRYGSWIRYQIPMNALWRHARPIRALRIHF